MDIEKTRKAKEQEINKARNRIHHRNRIIEKRKRIVEQNFLWNSGLQIKGENHPFLQEPGRMAKYNLACSCHLCKSEKHNKEEKKKEENSRLEAQNWEDYREL